MDLYGISSDLIIRMAEGFAKLKFTERLKKIEVATLCLNWYEGIEDFFKTHSISMELDILQSFDFYICEDELRILVCLHILAYKFQKYVVPNGNVILKAYGTKENVVILLKSDSMKITSENNLWDDGDEMDEISTAWVAVRKYLEIHKILKIYDYDEKNLILGIAIQKANE